jgi:glycosyltransferase involved in cell wall biosynthesis
VTHDITVVIPTIPPRARKLRQAITSALGQTLPPACIVIEIDHDHEGPAVVRNRALAKVETEYVAFLDDDDQFRANHLQLLRQCAEQTSADLVYPWFDVVSSRATPGWDPLGRFGMPFDPLALRQNNYIPVTVLARTKVVAAAGFANRSDVDATCEDWGCWLAMLDAGATFVHLAERTWVWNWHEGNTSGLTDRWQ